MPRVVELGAFVPFKGKAVRQIHVTRNGAVTGPVEIPGHITGDGEIILNDEDPRIRALSPEDKELLLQQLEADIDLLLPKRLP